MKFTRGEFFRLVGAPLFGIAMAFPALPLKREFHADYRRRDVSSGNDEGRLFGGKVFVSGREIRLCWYVDTAEGVVKSYDIRGDGQFYLADDHESVQSITLRGAIQLFDRTGKRLY